MSYNSKVYIDQDQDGDEQHLGSWTVYFEGDTDSFDNYREAQEVAADWADEHETEVEDGGEWDFD
jgi:hypothetical protein